MPDPQTTATFALPLLMAAQAQKEITHNEALILIDALLVPAAVEAGVNTPPATPGIGQCWLIGGAPTGAWTGQPLSLACWTPGGWRFAPMPLGAHVAVGPQHHWYRRDTAAWLPPAEIGAVTGGSVIDLEVRAQMQQLLDALAEAGIVTTI